MAEAVLSGRGSGKEGRVELGEQSEGEGAGASGQASLKLSTLGAGTSGRGGKIEQGMGDGEEGGGILVEVVGVSGAAAVVEAAGGLYHLWARFLLDSQGVGDAGALTCLHQVFEAGEAEAGIPADEGGHVSRIGAGGNKSKLGAAKRGLTSKPGCAKAADAKRGQGSPGIGGTDRQGDDLDWSRRGPGTRRHELGDSRNESGLQAPRVVPGAQAHRPAC